MAEHSTQVPSGPASSMFNGATILAPMVRVCSLGFRTLCADSGADVVFTEEVVAAKLRQCRRELRRYPPDSLRQGTESAEGEEVAEYVVYEPFKKSFKRAVVLAVHAGRQRHGGEADASNKEGRRSTRHVPVILQLGACDGRVAADAAALCCHDVDGIDVNMGCPKKFSISNGFGAALMDKTAVAGDILKCIHERINSPAALAARGGRLVPVSIKTRLKDAEDPQATVAMLQEIAQAAGHSPAQPVLHAITLHARLREDRPEAAPRVALAGEVARRCRESPDSLLANVCFVINGSVRTRAHGRSLCEAEGMDAAMLARSALWDPTHVFLSSAVPDSTEDSETQVQSEAHYMSAIKALLLYSMRYRAEFKNFKYHLTRTFPEVPCLKHRMPVVQQGLRSYEDCFAFFDLSEAERTACRGWACDVETVDAPPGAALALDAAPSAAMPVITSQPVEPLGSCVKKQRIEEAA